MGGPTHPWAMDATFFGNAFCSSQVATTAAFVSVRYVQVHHSLHDEYTCEAARTAAGGITTFLMALYIDMSHQIEGA